MRGIRLVVLLLVMAMLVVGTLVSAGPAAADGPQFMETSGPFSGLCTSNLESLRVYPADRDPWWNLQARWNGESWSTQDGQLYHFLLDGRSLYHWSGSVDRQHQVYQSQHSWKIYPVSSYTTDLASVAGWYEGRYEEGGVFGVWASAPLPLVGHLAGHGMGTFAGQTLHLTLVIADWGTSSGQCPEGQWPALNGTMTMQFGGKP